MSLTSPRFFTLHVSSDGTGGGGGGSEVEDDKISLCLCLSGWERSDSGDCIGGNGGSCGFEVEVDGNSLDSSLRLRGCRWCFVGGVGSSISGGDLEDEDDAFALTIVVIMKNVMYNVCMIKLRGLACLNCTSELSNALKIKWRRLDDRDANFEWNWFS